MSIPLSSLMNKKKRVQGKDSRGQGQGPIVDLAILDGDFGVQEASHRKLHETKVSGCHQKHAIKWPKI